VKNREVEQARVAVEEKAAQLALISKYKSEFLANMSHELRTPLNSLLILARLLAENSEHNLTPKQTEYAKTIHASGVDLLALINEILDLSKVEAGKMQVEPRAVALKDVQIFVDRSFRALAEQKSLEFRIELSPNLPDTMRTDPQRLQQVLKNLLANAFKFTERGSVELRVGLAAPGTAFSNDVLSRADKVISFSVVDTGIGIPRNKQKLIFEAFQQADGTTNRRYGGTGLGLSISREIARLLGGEIHVASTPGEGSDFTFFLPETYTEPFPTDDAVGPARPAAVVRSFDETPRPPATDSQVPSSEGPAIVAEVLDDAEKIRSGDRVILIIEDDLKFAKIMVEMAHKSDFKAVVATRGDTGIAMANELQPAAITLDVQLPIVNGITVLDKLKRNPRTRHIPVYVISVTERNQRMSGLGAFAYLEKPVSKEALEDAFMNLSGFLDRPLRRLLVVARTEEQRQVLVQAAQIGRDVETRSAATSEEAIAELKAATFDCVLIDLDPSDPSAIGLLEIVKMDADLRDLPVIVYANDTFHSDDDATLKRRADSWVLKGTAGSPAQLLWDTTLFLHRLEEGLPDRAKQIMTAEREHHARPGARKVLVVDDDVRNIFALTSVLEAKGLQVVYAQNGKAAVAALEDTPDIEVILMDIMMPEMDGYETIRAIRNHPQHGAIPIIAVTAKALKDDRLRCIAAGASDYLPKPVDAEKLVQMISIWTH